MHGDGHWTHTVTTLSSATVAPATIPAPVLAVDLSSAKAGDQLNYTLKQQVNTLGQDTLLRYTTWSQTVPLPSEVSYQSAQVLDGQGQVMAGATTTFDATTHKLTITLPTSYLTDTMPLSGETYQVKIKTTVNAGVGNGEVGSATATDVIDGQNLVSNTVSTTFGTYIAPVETSTIIIKYVDNYGQEINLTHITGVVGDSFKIVPAVIKDQHLVYLFSNQPLEGTYLPQNKMITLTYGYWHQDVYSHKDGSSDLVTFDGNNRVIEIDHQHIDGSMTQVEISYDHKSAVVSNTDTHQNNLSGPRKTILLNGPAALVKGNNGLKYSVKLLGNGDVLIQTVGVVKHGGQKQYDNVIMKSDGNYKVVTSTYLPGVGEVGLEKPGSRILTISGSANKLLKPNKKYNLIGREGQKYWIKLSSDGQLTVAGQIYLHNFRKASYRMHAGWNREYSHKGTEYSESSQRLPQTSEAREVIFIQTLMAIFFGALSMLGIKRRSKKYEEK